MSGFVASPPPSVAQPGAPVDLVAGDAFYPGVSITEFRDSMRIDDSATDIRVRDALRAGMAHVRRELAAWKGGHVLAGIAALADVPAETIDGETAAVQLYRRAVFCVAAADLAETHSEISATSAGSERIDDRMAPAGELRRAATHAIRDILGVPRTSVELI